MPPTAEIMDRLAQILARSAIKAPLYHGSPSAFERFSSGIGGGLFGSGTYLTDSPLVAAGYAYKNNPLAQDVIHRMQSVAAGNDRMTLRHNRELWNELNHSLSQASNAGGTWPVDPSIQAYHKALGFHPEPASQAPNIRQVLADVRNPFDVEQTLKPIDAREIANAFEGRTDPMGANRGRYSNQQLEGLLARKAPIQGSALFDALSSIHAGHVTPALQDLGYDALRYQGGNIAGPMRHNAYVVWDPKKVLNPWTLTPASIIAAIGAGRQALEPGSDIDNALAGA